MQSSQIRGRQSLVFQILFSIYEDKLQFRVGTEADSIVLEESEFWCIVQAIREFQRVFTAKSMVKGNVYYSGRKLVLQREGKSIYLDPKLYKGITGAVEDLLCMAVNTAFLITSSEDTNVLFYNGGDLSILIDPEDTLCINCKAIASFISQHKVIASLEDSEELQEIIRRGEIDFLRNLVLSQKGQITLDTVCVCVIKCNGYDSILLFAANRMIYVKYPNLLLDYASLSKFQKRLCKGDLSWTKQKS